MHHSYKQITWLNQVGFFCQIMHGSECKKKTPHKNPNHLQNKLHWTKQESLRNAFF